MLQEKAKKLITLGNLNDVFKCCSQFTKDQQFELLTLALTYQEAWLVLELLQHLGRYPNDLEEKEFTCYLRLIELSALQGDYALYQRLNKALKYSDNRSIIFYPQTIQENYTQARLPDWSASKHIPYMILHKTYVEKFFVLLKNEPFDSSVHIKQLGDARAGIDSCCNGEDFLKFGVLRRADDLSITPKSSYINYFERSRDRQDIYPIKASINGQNLTLTQIQSRWNGRENQYEQCWYHTEPSTFAVILPYLDKKINAIQAKYNSLHDRDTVDTIEKIRDIAEIHWWFAHAMFFHRGSAAATKILIEALFRLAGLEVTAWNTEPDCEALIEPSINDYQNNYQQFVCLSPIVQGATLNFNNQTDITPEEFMPTLLRNLLKSNQCTPTLAQDIMTKLQLSPQERQIKYQLNDVFLTDAELIALETHSLTREEILTIKNHPVLCSNSGINFLLKKQLTVKVSIDLAYVDSIHLLFSSAGEAILNKNLMTLKQIHSISFYHYYDPQWPEPRHNIDFIVSPQCVELLEEQILTGEFIEKNIALLVKLALDNTFNPIYSGFQSKTIDMPMLEQNDSFFKRKEQSCLFFSAACQEAIKLGYITTKQAIDFIQSNLFFPDIRCIVLIFKLWPFIPTIKQETVLFLSSLSEQNMWFLTNFIDVFYQRHADEDRILSTTPEKLTFFIAKQLTTYANLINKISEMGHADDFKQHADDLDTLRAALEQLYKNYLVSENKASFHTFYTESKAIIVAAEKNFEQESTLWNVITPILNALINALNVIRCLLFRTSSKIGLFKTKTFTEWENSSYVQAFKEELETLNLTASQNDMESPKR